MNKMIFSTALFFMPFMAANALELSKTNLCKKWHLSHYVYFWKKFDPDPLEQNDYILFNEDMTYESVDEGEKSEGKWTFNAKEKYILIYDEEGEKMKLEVEELSASKLVFEINHKDMKGLEIVHTSVKR